MRGSSDLSLRRRCGADELNCDRCCDACYGNACSHVCVSGVESSLLDRVQSTVCFSLIDRKRLTPRLFFTDCHRHRKKNTHNNTSIERVGKQERCVYFLSVLVCCVCGIVGRRRPKEQRASERCHHRTDRDSSDNTKAQPPHTHTHTTYIESAAYRLTHSISAPHCTAPHRSVFDST